MREAGARAMTDIRLARSRVGDKSMEVGGRAMTRGSELDGGGDRNHQVTVVMKGVVSVVRWCWTCRLAGALGNKPGDLGVGCTRVYVSACTCTWSQGREILNQP